MLRELEDGRSLASFLSEICDELYSDSPRLRNELVNRRQLSSAAAAARRTLIEMMISKSGEQALGIAGNPPEMTIYASVLRATGIHRKHDESWEFGPPTEKSGLMPVWRAIESFFVECELKRRAVPELFEILQHPPFGMKQGLIPIVFYQPFSSTILKSHSTKTKLLCQN